MFDVIKNLHNMDHWLIYVSSKTIKSTTIMFLQKLFDA